MTSTAAGAIAIDSSVLASVAYDTRTSVLCLEFRSGAIYRYFDVPPILFQALLAADSKGTFFHRFLRGSFPYALLRS
jgi:hypothetical protein